MTIGAAVVTYRKPEALASCLASLADQIPTELTYVKDNSEGKNLLYTAGINYGIRKALEAKCEFILVCCDDVIVGPGAVAKMANFLRDNTKCGIAVPVQVGRDGTVNCGGCTEAFPYGKHVVAPLGHELYEKPFETFWANGACFLLRADAVRECGLLDENMRFICSDSDYSFTFRSRGWTIHVVPEALVTHEADGALHYKNSFIDRVKDEDALFFMKKWLTGGVFRELAVEGPILNLETVQTQYYALISRLAVPEEK